MAGLRSLRQAERHSQPASSPQGGTERVRGGGESCCPPPAWPRFLGHLLVSGIFTGFQIISDSGNNKRLNISSHLESSGDLTSEMGSVRQTQAFLGKARARKQIKRQMGALSRKCQESHLPPLLCQRTWDEAPSPTRRSAPGWGRAQGLSSQP